VVRYPAMASAFSHAIVAASIGTAVCRPGGSIRFLALGALFSVVPDIDVVGFGVGIPYSDLLAHCGLTHSLAFAAVMARMGWFLCARRSAAQPGRWTVRWYLFLATASHGLLDAMTDGGLGVAFFSPLSNARYFLPWRPIVVSPIGVTAFSSERGLNVLRSEFKWIWLPSGTFALSTLAVVAALSSTFRHSHTACGPTVRKQAGCPGGALFFKAQVSDILRISTTIRV
jgi:inner membrane protein